MSSLEQGIQQSIQQKLQQALSPTHVELVNESSHHHGGSHGDTHYKLVVVSENFSGMTRVARQRLVQNLLDEERSRGLHALSLRALTPAEWEISKYQEFKSPKCVGSEF